MLARLQHIAAQEQVSILSSNAGKPDNRMLLAGLQPVMVTDRSFIRFESMKMYYDA
jgi:hypothetical protein